MTSERKKSRERMLTIPGMKGVLTVRALGALRNIGINPSDKESLKALFHQETMFTLWRSGGVGKVTWHCILDFMESNGLFREREIVYGGVCLSVAIKEARLKIERECREAELRVARERHEAELKRIEEQSYAVGSAWVGE